MHSIAFKSPIIRSSAASVLLLALAANSAFAQLGQDPVQNLHGLQRQFVIKSTLSRFPDPVVVVGDSIVEGSTLPRWVCNHAVVNAGIGGVATDSSMGSMLAKSLSGRRAALVIVSVGTNDAALGRTLESFRRNYAALLRQLAPLARAVAVISVPPPEQQTAEMTAAIEQYNQALPQIARQAGVSFVSLPAMPTPHTFDGIHLNAAGYEIWDQGVMSAAALVCDQ